MRILTTLIVVALTTPALSTLFLPGSRTDRVLTFSVILTGFILGDWFEKSWNESAHNSEKPPQGDTPAEKPPQGDTPASLQLNFQDPVTDYMEGFVFLNHAFLVLIILIIGIVGWLMFIILFLYREKRLRKALIFVHASVYESDWTGVPLLILLSLLKSSIALLYSLQGERKTGMPLKIVSHQWYWHPKVAENLLCSSEQITYFYCYHIVDEFTGLD